jgi:hypothetical protein
MLSVRYEAISIAMLGWGSLFLHDTNACNCLVSFFLATLASYVFDSRGRALRTKTHLSNPIPMLRRRLAR